MFEGRQGLLEVRRGLAIGRPCQSLRAGPLQIGQGLAPDLTPERVMSQSVNVLLQLVDIERFHGLQDACVQDPPPLGRKAAVGHLLGQGMLERVFQMGKIADFVEKLRRLKHPKALTKGVLRNIQTPNQDRIWHTLSYHCGGLEQETILLEQAVNASGENLLDRCGYLDA